MVRKHWPTTRTQTVRAAVLESPRGGRRGCSGTTLPALLVATALFAASVSAQPAADDKTADSAAPQDKIPQEGPDAANQRDQASAHFQRGIRLYRQGQFAEAFAAFLMAKELYPSPAFSYNLGRCAEHMKNTANALRYYREYLRESSTAEDSGDVSERIRTLEETLALRGVQQVTVLSEPTGATLYVESEPVGVTPWTAELKPGSYALRVVLSGYEDESEEFELGAERAVDVVVRLRRAEPPPPPPPRPVAQPQPAPKPQPSGRLAQVDVTHKRSARFRPWTWGVLAGSAVALGSAGIYELFRRNSEAEVPRHDTQLARLDQYNEMKSYQSTARVLVGVGSALALVGGGLLLWDLSFAPQATTKAAWTHPEHLTRGWSHGLRAQVGCDGRLCGFFMTEELQ